MINLKLLIPLFFISTLFNLTLKKEEVYYHQIRFTSTSVHIVNWNVADTIGISFVEEFVDEKNRTKELRFYNSRHELDWAGSGFLGGPIMKYEYEDDKVVETFFSSESQIANDFKTSEVPYQNIYFLNEANQILRVEEKYKIDFEWEEESLEETINHLKFYKRIKPEAESLESIFGFQFAFVKMNGLDPKLLK